MGIPHQQGPGARTGAGPQGGGTHSPAQPSPARELPGWGGAPGPGPAPTSWLRALHPSEPVAPLCSGKGGPAGLGWALRRVVWTRDSGLTVQMARELRGFGLQQSSGRGGGIGSGAVNSGGTLEVASRSPHRPVGTCPAPSFPHKPRPCWHCPGAGSSLLSPATGWPGLAPRLQALGASLSPATSTGHEHAVQAAAHPRVQEDGAGGLPPAPPGLPRPGALHLGAAPAQGAPAQPESHAQPPEVGCPQDLGLSSYAPPWGTYSDRSRVRQSKVCTGPRSL